MDPDVTTLRKLVAKARAIEKMREESIELERCGMGKFAKQKYQTACQEFVKDTAKTIIGAQT